MKEGGRASSLRVQGSREKNVLEESNCDEGRRSVSGNGNKFLHGVYYFRAGGNNGYTVVLGELQLLNIASAGAEDGIGRFLIRKSKTAPFSAPHPIVSRLLRISTSPSSPCIITLQNFPSAERVAGADHFGSRGTVTTNDG